jgi:diaminohydroxyphosphoribosylaminopyrimidine deaminase/5-amino-6-(5-phosphoribosylamino)uracil reductase
MFKKKKIGLIKVKLKNSEQLDLRQIMKKLYSLGFRNTLVEGGDLLTTNLLKNKIFNEFYLFKSQKKLPTNSDFVKFNGLNILSKKYPFRQNLNSSYGKDTITLYNK